jgi:hypothetical protein
VTSAHVPAVAVGRSRLVVTCVAVVVLAMVLAGFGRIAMLASATAIPIVLGRVFWDSAADLRATRAVDMVNVADSDEFRAERPSIEDRIRRKEHA